MHRGTIYLVDLNINAFQTRSVAGVLICAKRPSISPQIYGVINIDLFFSNIIK